MNPMPALAVPTLPEVSFDPTTLIPVPARVKVALQLLAALSFKTATKAVPGGEGEFHTIDGQSLTHAESNVQATACNLLNAYFLGKLRPDYWDKIVARQWQDEPLPEPVCSHGPEGPGHFLRCISCSQTPDDNCALCQGSGSIFIFPAKEGK